MVACGRVTHREVVAQVLDYGSWTKELRTEDLARIFDSDGRKSAINRGKSVMPGHPASRTPPIRLAPGLAHCPWRAILPRHYDLGAIRRPI